MKSNSKSKQNKHSKSSSTNNENNGGLLSKFKKSFTNRSKTSSNNSKNQQTLINNNTSNCNYLSNGLCSIPSSQAYSTFDGDYTDDFLDAISSKKTTLFGRKNIKCNIQSFNTPQIITATTENFQSLLNGLFCHISQNPHIIENILMMVVEDYINSVCERLLHEKMRSVYRRISNWHKNPITRPGFKIQTNDTKNGGNITPPENYFSTDNDTSLKKSTILNLNYNNEEQRRKIKSKIKKANENIKTSSDLSYSVTEKIKELNANRNKKLIKFKPKQQNNDTMNADISQTSSTCASKTLSKSTKSTKVLSVTADRQSLQNKDNQKRLRLFRKKLEKNNVCSLDVKGTSKTILNHNNLKIYNTVNIDIEPKNLKIKSPPVKSPKSSEEDYNLIHTQSDVVNDYKNMRTLNHYSDILYRPKIRRSVTFREPWTGYVAASPLRKNGGFLSQLEISCSKYDETNINNDYILQNSINSDLSSRSTTPQTLSKTVPLIQSNSPEKYDEIHESLNNCSSYFPKPTKVKDINNNFIFVNKLFHRKLDSHHKTLSPAIISLQSTPTLIDDKSNVQSTLENKKSITDINSKNYNLESLKSMKNDENSENMSVIEIISKPTCQKVDYDSSLNSIQNPQEFNINSCESNQNDSLRSSIKSSKIIETESIKINELLSDKLSKISPSVDSGFSGQNSTTFQEIVILDSENNSVDYGNPPSITPNIQLSPIKQQFNNLLKQKTSLYTHIKTANFSSSSNHEPNHHEFANKSYFLKPSEVLIKKEPPLTYPSTSIPIIKPMNTCSNLSSSPCTEQNALIGPYSTLSNPFKPFDPDNQMQPRLSRFYNTRVSGIGDNQLRSSVYKHTLSSKQKVRDKVSSKSQSSSDRAPMKFSRRFMKF